MGNGGHLNGRRGCDVGVAVPGRDAPGGFDAACSTPSDPFFPLPPTLLRGMVQCVPDFLYTVLRTVWADSASQWIA